MSDPQQLREKIARALFDHMLETTALARDLGYTFDGLDAEAQGRWLAEADALLPLVLGEKHEAWGEACMAIAWALDNGPTESAAAYVASNNPYLPQPTEGETE